LLPKPIGIALAVAWMIGDLPLTAMAEAPAPAEILKSLRERDDSLENLVVKVEWREFANGRLTNVDRQTTVMDMLGRMRVQSEFGPPGAPGQESCEIYNGEFTVDIVDDPNRNRLGGPHTAESQAEHERYLAATIEDGLGPNGKGPYVRRNPLGFIDQFLLTTLTELLADGASFDVQPVEGQRGIFEIRFRCSPEVDPTGIQHIARLDQNKGWVFTSHEQRDGNDGKLLSIKTCELEKDVNGVWLPKRGHWEDRWSAPLSDPPDVEWRFEVTDIRFNAPDFDESAFEVALKPRTWVTDNRYHVAYFVGDETAIGSRLAALAQEEAARIADLQKRLADASQPLSSDLARSRSLLVAVNVLVAAVLVSVWWWKRQRS
jgi:hypothetical protein